MVARQFDVRLTQCRGDGVRPPLTIHFIILENRQHYVHTYVQIYRSPSGSWSAVIKRWCTNSTALNFLVGAILYSHIIFVLGAPWQGQLPPLSKTKGSRKRNQSLSFFSGSKEAHTINQLRTSSSLMNEAKTKRARLKERFKGGVS